MGRLASFTVHYNNETLYIMQYLSTAVGRDDSKENECVTAGHAFQADHAVLLP